VLWALGEHEKAQGNLEAAAKLMSEAMSLYPRSATQYRLLSLAYLFVDLDEDDMAAKLFDEALSDNCGASPKPWPMPPTPSKAQATTEEHALFYEEHQSVQKPRRK